MIANGYDVAVMEHHAASSAAGFSNVYAQARLALYNISGIPNSFFDGISNVLGGSTGTYGAFLSKVTSRLAVPSDFSVSLNGMNDGLDYTVLLTIENVNPNMGTNFKAHLALTESNVMYGSTPFHYVTRRLWPDANGTAVEFSSQSTQSVMLQFTMDPTWNLDECEFIGFIQDMTTKEIHQAAKVAVLDLMPMFYNNAGCNAVSMVPVTNCAGSVEPVVTIQNDGADNLTSVEINYQVNDEELNTFSWSGDLGFGETELVTLPAVSFEMQDNNDLLIYTTMPNGNPDEDPVNDTTSTSFVPAMQAVPDVYLFLKLDDNPEETNWELRNSNDEVLYSGGNYVQANQFVKDTFELSVEDCYTFFIFDEGGDGLTGGGYFALRQSNMALIYENQDFSGAEELVQFSTLTVGVEEQQKQEAFTVFPNPFEEQTYISFTLEQASPVEITVYNVVGEVVTRMEKNTYSAGTHTRTFDARDLNAGIYFVQVRIGENLFTRKISLR